MRLPNDSQQIVIIGKNGSGKTVAGLAHLSVRSYDQMPWIVFNFKRDEHINSIARARHIGLDTVPSKPFVYVIDVHPEQDIVGMENFFRMIWERGDVGIYIDEGYMVGTRSSWFRTILTQGRSLQIPRIILAQRPTWLDRFVLSESDFFQVFHLTHKKDRRLVEEFVPVDLDRRLPQYHSYYYDVGLDEHDKLLPVPPMPEILQIFDNRLMQLEEQERRENATILVEQAPVKKVRAI